LDVVANTGPRLLLQAMEQWPLTSGLTATPLGPAGTEISGLDLSEPFDAAAEDALRQAMADHRVLVFRDQIKLETLGLAG
jgi:hypothetical protein